MPKKSPHLYKGKKNRAVQKGKFTRRYGKKGAYVYGAVVGKIRRERAANKGK